MKIENLQGHEALLCQDDGASHQQQLPQLRRVQAERVGGLLQPSVRGAQALLSSVLVLVLILLMITCVASIVVTIIVMCDCCCHD